jgi:hypothetical protein
MLSPILSHFPLKGICALAFQNLNQFEVHPFSMVLSKNPTDAPSWYSKQLPFLGDTTLGLRNITKPKLVCTEHAVNLFYIGDNARVFRTSMEMDGFPSNFGTSWMEIEAIDFYLGEDIIRSMQIYTL